MSKNLYITTIEPKSGKSIISLGIMDFLKGTIGKVAFFRPIISDPEIENEQDPDIMLITSFYQLDMKYEDSYAFTFSQAKDLINTGKHDQLINQILEKYKSLEQQYDFVLLEGTDYRGVTSAFEFDINTEIANNLGAPILLVTNARDKDINETLSSLIYAIESFAEKGTTILGTITTRVSPKDIKPLREKIAARLRGKNILTYSIAENETLKMLTMLEIKKALNAEILYGESEMIRHARHHVVAAMQLRNFLDHIKEGTLVITPGDRADIILGSLVSANSVLYPHIMGMILTGGLLPEENIKKLIEGFSSAFPILTTRYDTLRTVTKINEIDSHVLPTDSHKIATALGEFETSVDINELREKIMILQSSAVTPKMFEYELIQKARSRRKHIVLPEGSEERILKAVQILKQRDVVDITLLGDESLIKKEINKLGLNIDAVPVIDPQKSPKLDVYAEIYHQARQHKKVTLAMARDIMTDVSYFGTMMVHTGDADGMVSGSVHTTQHTIRPAFEFIKAKRGIEVISSVFFMCLEDKVLVYGDCAINPNPSAEQLADIAIASSRTARSFGITPRVAMLSYSTGESGKGEDVERVRAAVAIAKKKAPDLLLEGPIQYDAAVDMAVARKKMPGSQVAGRATVFIFPDLNTGNNTYKAVQRTAGAIAIGPVLQGLKKPVNDLSRGCTIADIVNTVAITAIQAQNG